MHKMSSWQFYHLQVIVKIGLSMGQRITRPAGNIEKTDVNVDYQTGNGDSYAIDGNGDHHPSDSNVEETSKVWFFYESTMPSTET